MNPDVSQIHQEGPFRLTCSGEASQESFLNNWLNDHIQDAQSILQKQVLFTEFGKSLRTSNDNQRDQLLYIQYCLVSTQLFIYQLAMEVLQQAACSGNYLLKEWTHSETGMK
uniref:Uncharacterized protein n=1 Tax=Populus trichocarpa TaxID=3694 RepID=A0A3N7EGS9_POPTR